METCHKCNRSDEVGKFRTIEPMTGSEVKSAVCTRCMCVVSTEGSDLDAIIYQVKKEMRII